ncbi:MAG TPA: Uma2 family endonuclease [Bryobacteraceae bacterium]|nr:Uma2 family endonuclease [Bryobacteraceae bacterium]
MICGEIETFGDQKDVVLNPLLIVEVLSPSTEGYDGGKKFELYRTIPSFQEYLVVHQDRRHVEHYFKQDDGSWLLGDHTGAEGSVAVARLGVHVSLSALYASAIDMEG